MIINNWTPDFTAKYNHAFPDSYLCFDTEFTGSDLRNDLILEIGHVMVEKGVVVDKFNIVLNWYNHPSVQANWLDYKLQNMRSVVGPGWKFNSEFVKKEGADPIQALNFYYKLFAAWDKRNLPFVAQNGQNADERILKGNFDRFINKSFSLPENNYFDTGSIFKANQIWEATSGDAVHFKQIVLPQRSETLKTYFNRVINLKIGGIKWSLKLILDHYKLLQKHKVIENEAHTAGFDSMCLHWIMEEYRSLLIPRAPVDSTHRVKTFDFLYEKEAKEYAQQNDKAQSKLDNTANNRVDNSKLAPVVPSKKPQRRQRLI
jgi:hypothetical protein